MNEADFRKLVSEKEEAMRRCFRFCGVKAENEDDLMQEILFLVWQKADGLRDKSKLHSWFGVILRRETVRHVQQFRRHCQRHCAWSHYEEVRTYKRGHMPESLVYRECSGFSETELYEQVLLLGSPAAEILLRHYVDGEPFGEIAEALGMRPGTVRSIACRSRQKLKGRVLEKELYAGGNFY